MDVRRFKADLYDLAHRACGDDKKVRSRTFGVADVLVGLYKKNLVKINHSALELVCAGALIREGYEVQVEHKLDRVLVCDVLGKKGSVNVVVEIETGFIPPEAALEPTTYARSRIASKIARYSGFADKFSLGTTPSYILDFPAFFVKSQSERSQAEARSIKGLTDVRYNRPPISIEELMKARLDSIFLIDVDSARTLELDPRAYSDGAAAFIRRNHAHTAPVIGRRLAR